MNFAVGVSGGVKLVEKRRFEIPVFFGHRTCFSDGLAVPMALEMPRIHPKGTKKEEEAWWNPGRRRNFKPPELPHFRLAADSRSDKRRSRYATVSLTPSVTLVNLLRS